MPCFIAVFAFSLIYTIAIVAASVELDLDADPNYVVTNMCSRWYHQSTIKDGVLYIDGGLQSYFLHDWSEVVNGYNEAMIRIDMNGAWDWQSNIFEQAMNKSSGRGGFTGQSPPSFISGALYQGAPGDDRVYLYGGTTSFWNTSFDGWRPPQPAQYGLWSFATSTSASPWNQYDITAGSPQRPSRGLWADAPDQGLAFYLNGQLDRGSSQSTEGLANGSSIPLDGMIVIDTLKYDAVNVSTTGASNTMPRTGGGMVYIPQYGEHGLLVALGGVYAGEDGAQTLASMSEIIMYDIAAYYAEPGASSSSGWYTQSATGDVPEPRQDSCVTVVTTPDNTTSNIYLYAGRGEADIMYDDVYVLSLPSFTWVKVYGPGQSPRYGHTCHTVSSQMITVGGLIRSGVCDWESKGVAVLDMSLVNWTSAYTPDFPPFTLPSAVAAKVKHDNGSLMTEPASGFGSPQLSQLFATKSINPKLSSAPPHAPNRLSTTSIIAAAVGGGIGLMIIVSTTILLVMRRRRRRSEVKRRSEYFDAVPEQTPAKELDPSSQLFEKAGDAGIHEIGIPVDRVHELEQPGHVHEKLDDKGDQKLINVI